MRSRKFRRRRRRRVYALWGDGETRKKESLPKGAVGQHRMCDCSSTGHASGERMCACVCYEPGVMVVVMVAV